ncbi:MAG: trypsin-like peptidase domain-containing protein [Chloroflexia bacterium]|nr:trypsin-like peptidase domain-containing protein [Chloroflexia bacterium]
MKVKRYLFGIGALVLLLLTLGGLLPRPVEALDRDVTRTVMRAAVQIWAVEEDNNGRLMSKWSGSGTIISADGLILTNCHVAMPRAMWDYPEFDYDFLVIAMTIRSDETPVPTYIAQVLQYDPYLDLAVIQISHMLDGSEVDPQDLNLTYLEVGDSDELELGDGLAIFGYPGIGGSTITLTTGNVSGFSPEAGVEGRAWIKTDATIAGGNSGGTAILDDGTLIGVPTEGGYGGAGIDEFADCRRLADTNGDGVVDENDSCIPMGGFINALRPVNLAKPLIKAASSGLGPQQPPKPDKPVQPSGEASMGRVVFSPAVNEYDQPITVLDVFPSGSGEIYMVFDYEGFEDGVSWQPILVYEGEVYDNIWGLASWNGGAEGTWWISIYNDPLPDGEYEFVLNYGGEELGSATVQVGGASSDDPVFYDIHFLYQGEEYGYVLPAGINEIAAELDYDNVSSNTNWSHVWYHEGREVAGGDGRALSGSSGTTSLLLNTDSGSLPKGFYRLDVYVGDRLAATSDFIIAGEESGDVGSGSVFGPITFAEGEGRNGEPVNPASEFDSGLNDLYAFFDYQGMQDGWQWTRRWYLDGELVVDTDNTWEAGEEGEDFWVSVYSEDGLPDGTYILELLVEGEFIQDGGCVIGEGSTPPPITPDPTDGVEMYGYIFDADTGNGIPGAMILFLQPGITVDEFQWIEEEVYALGEADRDGYYELSAPLVRGETYSVVAGAQGYNMIAEDGITIPEDLESPFQLDVDLQAAQ